MAAFTGGVLAQEVVKCTGKFTPIPGFMHFSAPEVLPDESPSSADTFPRGSRYDELAAVFGWPFVEKLGSLKYFMVGCGALGCEFMKNFALNNICCGENGLLIVTDADRIELSNLSRQFLFREHNVGQPKSIAASMMATVMNPGFKVEAMEMFVGPKTEVSQITQKRITIQKDYSEFISHTTAIPVPHLQLSTRCLNTRTLLMTNFGASLTECATHWTIWKRVSTSMCSALNTRSLCWKAEQWGRVATLVRYSMKI